MLKMQRPKSFKDLVLGILLFAVLGVGAYFIADALKAELVPAISWCAPAMKRLPRCRT